MIRIRRRTAWDILLRPILKLFWEPFSKKRSHFWNWWPYDAANLSTYRFVRAPGDSAARDRNTRWRMLWQTNFGWQSALVLEPDKPSRYCIGYASEPSGCGSAEFCDLILDGPVAVLLGPADTYFFAMSYPDGRPVQLRAVRQTAKAGLDGVDLI